MTNNRVWTFPCAERLGGRMLGSLVEEQRPLGAVGSQAQWPVKGSRSDMGMHAA